MEAIGRKSVTSVAFRCFASIVNKVRLQLEGLWPLESRSLYKCKILAAKLFEAAIMTARRRKRERYPELLRPGPQRFVVLACEVGGRWAAECGDLIRDLLRVRAPRAPAALRHASRAGWERRWWGMLSCAQQTAVAPTLLGNVWRSPHQPWDDGGPPLSDVLQLADPEEPSRLPLRS